MQRDQRALSELLAAVDSGSVDSLAPLVQAVMSRFEACEASLYVSDYDGTVLMPAPGSSVVGADPSPIEVEGTLPGRAYRTKELVEEQGPDSWRLWAPVIERSEPLGVLKLEASEIDDTTRRIARDAGVMVGHMLLTARGYTDAYELLRRRRDMSLAAEMHWDVLPARNFSDAAASICGDIEPAYDVGGDAFDYSFNSGFLDVGIMDAMGHGLEAALLSTQSVGAYRYARRRGAPLDEIAHTIDETLARQFGGDKFVTGFLARLDTSSGRFEWVNAGHVPPLLLRSGRIDSYLESEPLCPMGLQYLEEVTVRETELREGDCVMLYSDGVIDSRTPDGEQFTLERLARLVEAHDLQEGSVGEVVHKVIEEVTFHSGGPLRDDATCLLLQYKAQS